MLRITLLALTALTIPAGAHDRPRQAPVVVTESNPRQPTAAIVDIRPERVPIISGEATQVIVDDIRPTNRIRFVPKETYVYVSTDPYDHVH